MSLSARIQDMHVQKEVNVFKMNHEGEARMKICIAVVCMMVLFLPVPVFGQGNGACSGDMRVHGFISRGIWRAPPIFSLAIRKKRYLRLTSSE